MSTKTGKQGQPQKQTAASRAKQQAQQTQARLNPTMKAAPSTLADTERQQARAQRQAAARAAADQRKKQAMLKRVGIFGAIAVVLIGVIAALMLREAGKPGQAVDQQASRPHVKEGQSHPEYVTDPPTSGPHVGQVPEFKVYSQPITKELQVHGLEDGGAIISYKPGLDKTTVDRLAALAQTYYDKPDPDPRNIQIQHANHVIVAPYTFKNLDDTIVLTSWNRIDHLPAYDEARIRRFLDAYAGWDQHAASDNGQVIPGLSGQ